jgi:hypothetical protein
MKIFCLIPASSDWGDNGHDNLFFYHHRLKNISSLAFLKSIVKNNLDE